MGRSTRLRLGEVRRIFHLLGEMRELCDDPTAARRHAVESLCRLIGARQGAFLEWEGFSAGGRLRLLSMTPGGWTSPVALRMWDGLLRSERWRDDTLIDAATRISGRVVTRLREQLVPDEQWLASHTLTYDIIRLCEIDSHLCAFHRRPRDEACGITLHRAWGDRRFDAHDRNLLHLFNVELYRAEVIRHVRRLEEPPLSPRREQVLQLLLQGGSEKEIAHDLRLSRHTVNGHVKELYRRFKVSSRSELMARFIASSRPGRTAPTSRPAANAPLPH